MAWARVRAGAPLDVTCMRIGEALDEAVARQGSVENLSVTAGVGDMVRPDGPSGVWHIPAGRRREQVLEAITSAGVQLGSLATVSQGLISGADRVSQANVDRLDGAEPEDVGRGVFVLTPDELAEARIPQDHPLVQPFVKNSELERFALTAVPRFRLLYLDETADPMADPAIEAHLRRYRSLLEARREVRTGAIPWWRLHWPRARGLFEQPKILSPHRARRNTFAYVESPLFASADAYVIGDADPGELVRLTGLLNSSVADFWFAHRGKRKGSQREYYATPLRTIPVPHPGRSEAAPEPRLADRLPLDEAIVDRVTWAAEKGDWLAVDSAIRRITGAIIDLRTRPATSDLHEIALEIVEERRLEGLLDSVVAVRYGLYGEDAWMYEVVLEASSD
jgi:hypothetical protein